MNRNGKHDLKKGYRTHLLIIHFVQSKRTAIIPHNGSRTSSTGRRGKCTIMQEPQPQAELDIRPQFTTNCILILQRYSSCIDSAILPKRQKLHERPDCKKKSRVLSVFCTNENSLSFSVFEFHCMSIYTFYISFQFCHSGTEYSIFHLLIYCTLLSRHFKKVIFFTSR